MRISKSQRSPIQLKTLYCLASLAILSGGTHAQQPTPGAASGHERPSPQEAAAPVLEEIIVTAQKMTESLQKVPIAVTALDTRELEQRGLSALTTLVGVSIPGLMIQKNGNPSVVRIDMRGIKTGDPQQSTLESGVGIYLDDVYMARTGGQSISISEIQQMEILRGPQGTLFGRNAEGGAIRYVTKDPTGQLGGNVKLGTGNYGIYDQEAHINFPAFNDLSLKLDVKGYGNGAFTRNPASPTPLAEHEDYGKLDVAGYAFSALFKPNAQFRAKYVYDNATAKSTTWNWLHGPIPGSCVNGPCNSSVTFIAGGIYPDDRNVDTADMGLYNKTNTADSSGHRLQLEYEFNPDLKLKSITAYRKLHDTQPGYQLGTSFSFTSFGGRPTNAIGLVLRPGIGSDGVASAGLSPTATLVYGATGLVGVGEVMQDQTSQEFQLTGKTEHTLWTAGLFFFRENANDIRATEFSVVYTGFAAGRPINPVATDPFFLGASNKIQTQVHAHSAAAFGQITWTPAWIERLHLTGGLRYSTDYKTFHRDINAGLPVSLSQPTYDKHRVDPAATLAYDVTDTTNAYIRLARGYRAGGASVRAPWTGPLAQFATFVEEVNSTLELGLKSELYDHRLRFNAAGYYSKVKNMQQGAQLVPTNPQATSIVNMPGETIVQGLELEGEFAATDRLRLSGNLALQDYKLASEVQQYINAFDPGSQYTLALPKWSGALAVDYSLPVDIGQLVFHADYNRAQKGPLTERANKGGYFPQGGIDVANARVTLQDIKAGMGDARLKVAVYVNNVFNKIYPVFTTNADNFVLANPRTYGLELSADF